MAVKKLVVKKGSKPATNTMAARNASKTAVKSQKSSSAKKSAVQGMVKRHNTGLFGFDFSSTKVQVVAASLLVALMGGCFYVVRSYAASKPGPSANCSQVTLRKGSKSECVRKLQFALSVAGAGGSTATSDGAFGPKTKAAVVSFQSQNGLKADGVVGKKTGAAICAKVGSTEYCAGGSQQPAASAGPSTQGSTQSQTHFVAGVQLLPFDISKGFSQGGSGHYYSQVASTCDQINNYQQWEGPKSGGIGISNHDKRCRFVYEMWGTAIVDKDGKLPPNTALKDKFKDCSIIINIEYDGAGSQATNRWGWPGFRRRKAVGCDYFGSLKNSVSYNSPVFKGTVCEKGGNYPHKDWCDKQ